ncbi:MAG: class I SAM-dependent methyltransferase [Gemmatimonadota bacterium]
MKTYELAACPACSSQASRLVADGDALKDEIEELWQFHLLRRKHGVPARHLYDRAFFTLDPPLQLVACTECGTLYRNPREKADAVVETYEQEQADAVVLESLFEAQKRSYRRQADELRRLAGRTGSGLEVGSYVGAFLAAAREVGWDFEGIDVNADAAEFARGKGLHADAGSLDTVSVQRQFDAVAIWNCFDQLSDPRATLAQAFALLSTGGILAIRVPNGQCYRRWRNGGRPGLVAGLVLAHNNLLGFPYRQGFTPTSLSQILERAGFRVEQIRHDVLVSTADPWTRRWAVWEERIVKRALRLLSLGPAPWFEVYARKP